MERQGITKATLAERMRSSRAQIDRILKAKGNITTESLQRAAALVGANFARNWSERQGYRASHEELRGSGV